MKDERGPGLITRLAISAPFAVNVSGTGYAGPTHNTAFWGRSTDTFSIVSTGFPARLCRVSLHAAAFVNSAEFDQRVPRP